MHRLEPRDLCIIGSSIDTVVHSARVEAAYSKQKRWVIAWACNLTGRHTGFDWETCRERDVWQLAVADDPEITIRGNHNAADNRRHNEPKRPVDWLPRTALSRVQQGDIRFECHRAM